MPVPSPRPFSSWGSFVLSGIIRRNPSRIIHIPDSALETSLRSPPTSFASEVTARLNETVQLFLSPLVSLQHSPPVSVLVPNPQSSELGMHLAQSYAASGVSPPSTSPLLQETSFTVHPCFPVGALQDSWTWRDLFTGDPPLVPLDQRVQSLWRLQAQRTRDLDRASRRDPPIWEDVTMNFAAKVLDLSYLPHGSRSDSRNSSMSGTGPSTIISVTTPAKRSLHLL